MKRIGLKSSNILASALLVALTMVQAGRSMAQMKTDEKGVGDATIHGHVTNPIGQPVTTGEVRMTTDKTSQPADRKYQYRTKLDANGDYKIPNVAPGNYVVFVFQTGATPKDDKSLDFNDGVVLTSGADKTVNFDMTRPEYLASMSPEDRKALEEYKKKNAEIVANNSKIQNLNAQLTQARADIKAGNNDAAITAMQQATTAKPDEGILWITLGDAQLGAARMQPPRQPRPRELQRATPPSWRSTTTPPPRIRKAST